MNMTIEMPIIQMFEKLINMLLCLQMFVHNILNSSMLEECKLSWNLISKG
jgi:hypothetical protein